MLNLKFDSKIPIINGKLAGLIDAICNIRNIYITLRMKIELLTLKIALLSTICFINMGCGNGNSPRADYSELLLRLEEGDLLFRKGTGVVGHIVTSVDNRGEFSHVGIVVRRGDEWQVIHAVPHEPDFEGDFDRVKIESVDSFLGRYPNATIGHYRTTLASEQVAIAVLNATLDYLFSQHHLKHHHLNYLFPRNNCLFGY